MCVDSKQIEDNVSQSMHHLTITDRYLHPQLDESVCYSEIDINTSLYQTDSQASSSSKGSNGNDPQTSIQTTGHLLLTDFLHSCSAHSRAIQKVMGGRQRTY